MTATYTNTLLTYKDRTRFRLGDTDTTDALLSDEEIAAAYALKGDEDAAVAYLAQGLIARWGREPDQVTADGVTFRWSERIAVWREIVSTTAAASTSGLRIRRLARPQLMNGGTES